MKKLMKRLIAVAAAITMVLAMAIPAMAATITVENATYNKTYTAYKIFDASYNADGSAVSYKVDAEHKDDVSTELFDVSSVADSDGKCTVTKKNGATDEQIITWLGTNYSKFDATGTNGTFNTNNDTVTFENVGAGYYYITSTLGSAITVASVKDTITIKDKNASAPTTPVKKIVSVDENTVKDTDAADAADAHVGSTIGFKITGNATQYTTSGTGENVTYTKNPSYVITDNYKNLTLPTQKSDYTVKVNGTAIATDAFELDTTTAGTVKITIPLVDNSGNFLYEAKGDKSAQIPVEVTYNATITAAAADETATNVAGDSNNTLTTYKFQLAKVDQDQNPLKGAQFTLTKIGETTPLTFTANNDGSYTYDPTGTVTELDMTKNTTIVVKGLDKSWNYTLHESKVPNGYNQADDETINGSELSPVTTENISAYKVTVTNKQGSVLPSTGGMGTTIFYVIGAALVIGAGVVLVTRRRLSK